MSRKAVKFRHILGKPGQESYSLFAWARVSI